MFLDELPSASLAVQAKLLRAVEGGEFVRVGGVRPERASFRLVAAVSRPPGELVVSGALREDLFHRLAACWLHLIPLRERRHDIGLLAEFFLTQFCAIGTRPLRLEPSALALLRAYDWPGNVRQLRGVIQALAVFAEDDRVTAAEVERELRGALTVVDERVHLERMLAAYGWNASATARALGMGRTKLYGLLRLHGIRRPMPAASAWEPVRTECSPSVRARTGAGPVPWA